MTTSDFDHDYSALRTTAGLLDLPRRTRLRVDGSARAKFLQGILTNDVSGLKAGHGVYAAVLTGKGKMLADLTVYAGDHWWWIDAEAEVADTLPALLTRYTIGTDAEVSDLAATHSVQGLYGPRAPSIVAAAISGLSPPTEALSLVEIALGGDPLIVAEAGYPGTPGYKILVPAGATGLVRNALLAAGATAVETSALETVRIETGVPRFGVDMTGENFPPEARIEERAISYTKGCYMGQETIARIKTYGHVNRLFVGLETETDRPIPIGTRMLSAEEPGKDVGYVTSSVKSPTLHRVIALGYIHRALEAPGTPVVLDVDAGIRATVAPLPFVPPG